ncbi:MAG: PI-PLC domain-containing protein [Planctomycetota bacterium]
MILQHAPFCEGTDFEEWLEYFDHAFVILNIKEEGIEKTVQALINKKKVANYFYLDVSFPFIVELVNSGQKKIALRFSEYESIETCLSLAGKVDWIWVDCLSRFPLDRKSYEKLSTYFKICIVSPDLLGRESEVKEVQRLVSGMKIDAVCTKLPKMWSGE